MSQSQIRNFCVVAHIDHGKSTLADRLLELTGTVAKRDMHEQLLDSNPIERERGITIKLAPVRMMYHVSRVKYQDQKNVTHDTLTHDAYILNLIDTPGHVDFGYEVSRSLAACEGALLVVDATQGVQAQTLANLHQARAHGLTIIPLINKIDMPHARIEETGRELESLGFSSLSSPSSPSTPILISAKTGENVEQVLEAIVDRVPPPKGVPDAATRALVFSSYYDSHKGVVVLVRVVDGEISFERGRLAKLRFLATGMEIEPIEIGYFSPKMIPCDILRCGEVGYIATGLKDVKLAKVGDTVTTSDRLMNDDLRFTNKTASNELINHKSYIVNLLPGYKEPKPMVFLGLFPMSADEYQESREAMEKLRLSDSAFTFRPISSLALGNGFHCGFLGLLHAEVVQERILREFGLTMLATSPSVEYRIKRTHSSKLLQTPPNSSNESVPWTSIQSAEELPDPSLIEAVAEPIMSVTIFTPKRFVGAVMQLAQEKRGEYIDMKYFGTSQQPLEGHPLQMASDSSAHGTQVELTYLIPLSEMIVDFFDRLKSITEGYASLDYEFFDWQPVDVSKVDILVNREKVDAFSFLVIRDQAVTRSRAMVERLAAVIPRQQFEIPIQAAIGGSVIARADVKSFRKDVTKKLYGGDRTRKDKLLDKQKKGKAKMKLIGRVEIPQSAFFAVLKRG